MMMPIPSTSMKTVIRMKIMAALRPCAGGFKPTSIAARPGIGPAAGTRELS